MGVSISVMNVAITAMLFVLASIAYASESISNLKPEEVLVIANQASPDSLAVAKHYMAERAIPAGNLFLLDYPEYRSPEPLDGNPLWLSHADFRRRMAEPLKKFLVEHGLRESILCFVTTMDTPYRVGEFQLTASELADQTAAPVTIPATPRPTPQDMEFRKANASFDSELANLYPEEDRSDRAILLRRRADIGITPFPYPASLFEFRVAFSEQFTPLRQTHQAQQKEPGDLERKRMYLGWFPNPYQGSSTDFRTFRKKQLADPANGLMYLVARLDGPTVDIAKALVDKAKRAEAHGLKGTAYFDARGTGEDRTGYGQGDWWINRAYAETRKAGVKAVLDTRPELFAAGQCPDTILYWGFYKVFDFTDAFNGTFPDGAIACHIASFEAANLRWQPEKINNGQHGPWCTGFLHAGITVTIGSVSEPYLEAFPYTEIFFPQLFAGRSIAETYWSAVPHVSWMMVLIGDPLYVPYPHH